MTGDGLKQMLGTITTSFQQSGSGPDGAKSLPGQLAGAHAHAGPPGRDRRGGRRTRTARGRTERGTGRPARRTRPTPPGSATSRSAAAPSSTRPWRRTDPQGDTRHGTRQRLPRPTQQHAPADLPLPVQPDEPDGEALVQVGVRDRVRQVGLLGDRGRPRRARHAGRALRRPESDGAEAHELAGARGQAERAAQALARLPARRHRSRPGRRRRGAGRRALRRLDRARPGDPALVRQPGVEAARAHPDAARTGRSPARVRRPSASSSTAGCRWTA